MELRGIVKRVPGRPAVYAEGSRKKLTMELDRNGIADLDMVAEQMGITRTEALDQAIALWLRKAGGVRE